MSGRAGTSAPPTADRTVTNADAAALFREVADLLDVLGERFKPEAYRRAARSLETLTEGLAAVSARGELESIPGVGAAIAEKIRELLTTGTIGYRERLRHDVPAGVAEMMRLSGVGPKTARRFWIELGVDGPPALAAAVEAGRLDGVKGFGPRKIAQLRDAVAAALAQPKRVGGRTPIEEALPLAESLVRRLRERSPAERVEVAGSLRRRRETVGDLDLLVTSSDPEKVFDAFSALEEVRVVRLRGGTKETVVLANGMQVDLRVVEPAAFGAALQYFTGSKEHNVRLRSIARERGLKVNEYGVYRGDERIAGASEEEVYAALGLSWIPPEIRENTGEIEAAASGRLGALVEERDLIDEEHLHLPETASATDVERIVADARARRLERVGVVVGGVREDGTTFALSAPVRSALAAHLAPHGPVRRLLEVAPGAVPAGLATLEHDGTLVRPTGSGPEPPGGEGLGQEGYRLVVHLRASGEPESERLRRWLGWARSTGAALEVGPGPERLDASWAREARTVGVRLAVPTGLGAPADDPTGPIALGFARRAGCRPSEILNARDAASPAPTRRPRPTGTRGATGPRAPQGPSGPRRG